MARKRLFSKLAQLAFATAALSMTAPMNANATSVELFVCDAIGDGHYEVNVIADRQTSAQIDYVIGGGRNDIGVQLRHIRGQNFDRFVGPGVDFTYSNGLGTFIDTNAGEQVNCFSSAYQGNSNSNHFGNQNRNNQNGSQAGPVLNIPGLSLGGSVRSGPGVHHQKIGSIYGRNPITIVRNTGVRMNGYDWFEIRGPAGRPGYQWGGIMCSPNQQLFGIYQRCN